MALQTFAGKALGAERVVVVRESVVSAEQTDALSAIILLLRGTAISRKLRFAQLRWIGVSKPTVA
ncbi:hypothetical protein [Nocardioides coralli]|uniref:hypothetical protein n=1 Tax=Nocardioides coralli TaxID=2872154 RepID=UPI001CA3DA80|nr:hypothetical protein [Nocardioides coralli]QZY29703.1 hypothetical protein K6T13_03140 [Nocardioides coralli]